MPSKSRRHIGKTVNLSEKRIGDRRQIGKVDVSSRRVSCASSFDDIRQIAEFVGCKPEVSRIDQIDARAVDPTVGKSDSFRVVDRVSSEIRIARSAGQIEEVVARREDVFIEVVDKPDVPKWRIAIERQGVEKFRNTVLEPRLDGPADLGIVVACERTATDNHVGRNERRRLGDRGGREANRISIATDIDVVVECKDDRFVDEQLRVALGRNPAPRRKATFSTCVWLEGEKAWAVDIDIVVDEGATIDFRSKRQDDFTRGRIASVVVGIEGRTAIDPEPRAYGIIADGCEDHREARLPEGLNATADAVGMI